MTPTKRRSDGRRNDAPAANGAGAEAGQDSGLSFEKAVERLEAIVGGMEGGALGLEEMIARFEEGQRLIRFCAQKLNEVEKKVEILVKKGDKVLTEPFEETADVEEGSRQTSEEKDLF